MDDLTHAFTGALLAKAVFSGEEKEEKIVVRALWVSALAPDIDFILRAFGFETYILYHRGFTHSLFGLPFLALLLGWIFYHLGPLKRLRYLTFLCACGIASHIFLDLITSYGTMVLSPLSDRRFSWDLVFIIDPVFTSIVAFPLLLSRWRGDRLKGLCRVGLLLLTAYLSLCAMNHHEALQRVKEAAQARGISFTKADAFPQPLSPFRWMGVVEGPEATYRIWVDLFEDRENQVELQAFPKKENNPYVKRADRQESIHLYRWFARYPVVSYKEANGRHVVEYFDLRFSLEGLGLRRRPFIMQVVLDDEGRVLSEGFDR